jgi:hypothetical protein
LFAIVNCDISRNDPWCGEIVYGFSEGRFPESPSR